MDQEVVDEDQEVVDERVACVWRKNPLTDTWHINVAPLLWRHTNLAKTFEMRGGSGIRKLVNVPPIREELDEQICLDGWWETALISVPIDSVYFSQCSIKDEMCVDTDRDGKKIVTPLKNKIDEMNDEWSRGKLKEFNQFRVEPIQVAKVGDSYITSDNRRLHCLKAAGFQRIFVKVIPLCDINHYKFSAHKEVSKERRTINGLTLLGEGEIKNAEGEMTNTDIWGMKQIHVRKKTAW